MNIYKKKFKRVSVLNLSRNTKVLFHIQWYQKKYGRSNFPIPGVNRDEEYQMKVEERINFTKKKWFKNPAYSHYVCYILQTYINR